MSILEQLKPVKKKQIGLFQSVFVRYYNKDCSVLI